MKDTNKHSFEEEFRKVFEEAEATPSPVLWAEIDAHLANQEASRYKRRLFYYKLSAVAATILLAGFLGLWLLGNDKFNNEPAIAVFQESGNSSASENTSRPAVTEELAANTNVPATTKPKGKSNTGNTVSATAQGNTLSTETNNTKEQIALQQRAKSVRSGELKTNVTPGTQNVPADTDATLALSTEKISSQESAQPAAPEDTVQNGDQVIALAKENPVSSGKKSIRNNPSFNHSDRTNNHQDVKQPANGEERGFIVVPAESDLVAQQNKEFYAITHLSTSIPVGKEIFTIEAPSVQIKTSPYPFWLEEEEEEKEKKTTTTSRWALALAFTPSQFDPNMQVSPTPAASVNAKSAFSGYNGATNLSTGQTAGVASPASQDLQNAENFGLSYNVGLNVQYALSEKFSLHSGLQYMHNNSQITTDNYFENFSNKERYPVFLSVLGVENAATEIITNSNTMMEGQVVNAPAINNQNADIAQRLENTYPGVTKVLVQNLYQYMSIPLRVNYKLLNKKLSTSVGAGIAADIFLKNTVGNTNARVAPVEFNRQNNRLYKSVGISGLVSARLNYQFSGKYSVYVEPSYRTALSSFTKSSEVRSLPNSFGVGTGLQYRF